MSAQKIPFFFFLQPPYCTVTVPQPKQYYGTFTVRRCTGKVYSAERMSSGSGRYHKACFSCAHCKRMLDQGSATDSPTMELLCRPCYTKQHGPQAIPLDGSSVLTMAALPPTGGEPGCPRGGGAVFEAERVSSKVRSE